MKSLINEIRMHFASQVQGIRQLTNLPNDYAAFSFRQGVEYGVAIRLSNNMEIYEEASQITLKSMNIMGHFYLALSCCDEEFRNEFAKFGCYFVAPGENGETRDTLLSTPYKWWEGWIGMLGNRISSKNGYTVIAEMIALCELYATDKSIKWTASQAGSHDIESDNGSFEIKSSLKKAETKVTISSQFQLDSVKPLQLWFIRMEESAQGISINDLKNQLISLGYSSTQIESELEHKGFISGNRIRDRKYVVLEKRKFDVDSNFPRIVESSFKNDVYPKNIVKILYTIDLEGLPYTS